MEETIFAQRVEKLRTSLDASGMRAAILSRPQHVFYFTGTMPGPSPALLIVTQKRMMAVAAAPIAACETIQYVDYDIYRGWNLAEAVGNALDKALSACFPTGRIVGLELDHLPAAWLITALRHLREPRDLKDLLWRIRRIKDPVEQEQIAANVSGNDRVFQKVQGILKPGISELAVWAVIQEAMCQNAGGPITLEGDLGAGPRSSNPDAKPGHNALQKGDTVFIDIYSATHHYYADTTRVFVLGEPDARQRQVHETLQAALRAGEALLKAGTPANQVDAAVRGVIEKAGFGANFPHHSGHAFGLFQQEKPYLIPAESMLLETGMIVTIEPGIYISGWGGMRLEGNYLIESDGARRLDTFPSELIVC